ncbi:MAG: hypothetical protein ACRDKJ_06185 [Actinomycetota bacterium]
MDRFIVGDAPRGFETVVPLRTPLPSNWLLLVTLETTRISPSIGVRLSDLDVGKVWHVDEQVSLDEFLRRTRC